MPELKYRAAWNDWKCPDCVFIAIELRGVGPALNCPVCSAVDKERSRCIGILQTELMLLRDTPGNNAAIRQFGARVLDAIEDGTIEPRRDKELAIPAERKRKEWIETKCEVGTGFLVDSFLVKPLEDHLL